MKNIMHRSTVEPFCEPFLKNFMYKASTSSRSLLQEMKETLNC